MTKVQHTRVKKIQLDHMKKLLGLIKKCAYLVEQRPDATNFICNSITSMS